LKTALGDDALKFLHNLKCPEADMNITEKILAVLDRNLTPNIHVIYERAVFNSTIQEGENSEDFVNNLRKKIKYCNYGAIENELLRDRIVVGCRDNEL
jgi:hypothetical protein